MDAVTPNPDPRVSQPHGLGLTAQGAPGLPQARANSGSDDASSAQTTGRALPSEGSCATRGVGAAACCNGGVQQQCPPPWIPHCLATTFFGPCEAHRHLKKNECTYFCTTCALGPGGQCQHCMCHHQGHEVIQVRRYVYCDVVRAVDINSYVDVTGIQAYIINQAKVVFLNARPQAKLGALGDPDCCRNCARHLREGFAYCCLACKVNAIEKGVDVSASCAPASPSSADAAYSVAPATLALGEAMPRSASMAAGPYAIGGSADYSAALPRVGSSSSDSSAFASASPSNASARMAGAAAAGRQQARAKPTAQGAVAGKRKSQDVRPRAATNQRSSGSKRVRYFPGSWEEGAAACEGSKRETGHFGGAADRMDGDDSSSCEPGEETCAYFPVRSAADRGAGGWGEGRHAVRRAPTPSLWAEGEEDCEEELAAVHPSQLAAAKRRRRSSGGGGGVPAASGVSKARTPTPRPSPAVASPPAAPLWHQQPLPRRREAPAAACPSDSSRDSTFPAPSRQPGGSFHAPSHCSSPMLQLFWAADAAVAAASAAQARAEANAAAGAAAAAAAKMLPLFAPACGSACALEYSTGSALLAGGGRRKQGVPQRSHDG